MRCLAPIFSSNSVTTMYNLMYQTGNHIEKVDLLCLMQDISQVAACCQIILLMLVMFTGNPGVYMQGVGFMYISDNFCSKKFLAAMFMISTFPSWVVLACSVALEKDVVRRKLLILLISTPLPIGIGIVFFSLCTTPGLHYVFVNVFVVAVATIHMAVAHTAKHVEFLQTYCALVVTTSVSGLCFLILALVEKGPSTSRDVAVICEYIAVCGFIIANSLSTDRVREHVR